MSLDNALLNIAMRTLELMTQERDNYKKQLEDNEWKIEADLQTRIASLESRLAVAVELLKRIAANGSEQYEGTDEQVPRDHLAALICCMRYEAFRALEEIQK